MTRQAGRDFYPAWACVYPLTKRARDFWTGYWTARIERLGPRCGADGTCCGAPTGCGDSDPDWLRYIRFLVRRVFR